jgi:uncharacterized protein DUF1501
MNFREFQRIQARRSFLQQCAGGLGTIALWHLMDSEGRASDSGSSLPDINPLKPRAPHFTPKAKNVIFLFMEGGPSQLDLFDPKPALSKYDGQSLPPSMTKDLKLAFIKPDAKVWSSPRTFTPHGQCGMEISDYLPHTAARADDICLIRSVVTDQFNHHPGQLMITSGTGLLGRPTMGAWVTYGLGSESKNLPGFVALTSGAGSPGAGSGNWANGFLPSSFQGVPFRNVGDPVLHLSNLPGVDDKDQRMTLDAIRDLNQQSFARAGDMEIASRIASYELAFRMQSAGPELLDFSKESPSTLEMYGINQELTRPFATNCLLARRMIERGVRFVQLMHPTWDDHSDLNKKLKKNCEITDQPTAALLKDLKERGLLDSTLVIWGSEFGRTPLVQSLGFVGESWGRDHHPLAFSMWMAGGGIKGGQVVGKTDDLGFNVIEDRIHVHDLHATILYCLGLDHKRLTYRHMGRDFRLTDVEGEVVHKLLA